MPTEAFGSATLLLMSPTPAFPFLNAPVEGLLYRAYVQPRLHRPISAHPHRPGPDRQTAHA